MNKTILITGATNGIGKATAVELAKKGSVNILIHGRSSEKGQAVIEEIKRNYPKAKIELEKLLQPESPYQKGAKNLLKKLDGS